MNIMYPQEYRLVNSKDRQQQLLALMQNCFEILSGVRIAVYNCNIICEEYYKKTGGSVFCNNCFIANNKRHLFNDIQSIVRCCEMYKSGYLDGTDIVDGLTKSLAIINKLESGYYFKKWGLL